MNGPSLLDFISDKAMNKLYYSTKQICRREQKKPFCSCTISVHNFKASVYRCRKQIKQCILILNLTFNIEFLFSISYDNVYMRFIERQYMFQKPNKISNFHVLMLCLIHGHSGRPAIPQTSLNGFLPRV